MLLKIVESTLDIKSAKAFIKKLDVGPILYEIMVVYNFILFDTDRINIHRIIQVSFEYYEGEYYKQK